MIGILLDNNAYEQDIRELLMAFYPGEMFTHDENQDTLFDVIGGFQTEASPSGKEKREYMLQILSKGTSSCAAETFPLEGLEELKAEYQQMLEGKPLYVEESNRFKTKNQIKRRLYALLFSRTGNILPWGTLTGIRPTKIVLTKLKAGETEAEIRAYMKETYLTSEEKIELSLEIARREQELLSDIEDHTHGYSLYIGIPFCPTTCLYCSFTSFPIGKWVGRTTHYLDALYEEMTDTQALMKHRVPDTVYIGGGTPTSLSAEDLDSLLARTKEIFGITSDTEFTVEAGRPDSITEEKLKVLRKHGITRISINPQTMKQETLDLIGRHHTVEMVIDCFQMARRLGFDNINMDLIIGLPEETIEDVRHTMEAIKALKPDSLTVHSLAIKRAARLNICKEQYADLTITNTEEMINLTMQYARELDLHPYYLYRQKNMAGNFENVGYAAHGKACIYNIMIMEEEQTILACGAGTTTKVLFPEENRLERAENVKDVAIYMEKLAEMVARKEKLLAKIQN